MPTLTMNVACFLKMTNWCVASGVPPGSDPCCDLLSPAVAAQLSHRQRASVEALLKHLTKADYDILQVSVCVLIFLRGTLVSLYLPT